MLTAAHHAPIAVARTAIIMSPAFHASFLTSFIAHWRD